LKTASHAGGFNAHTEGEIGAGTQENGGTKAKMGFSMGANGRAGGGS
jgi:hypothetical protein